MCNFIKKDFENGFSVFLMNSEQFLDLPEKYLSKWHTFFQVTQALPGLQRYKDSMRFHNEIESIFLLMSKAASLGQLDIICKKVTA